MIQTLPLAGEVEVDEVHSGGLEGNEHAKDKLNVGGGVAGKTFVVGMKNRDTNQIKAKVVESKDKS
ncbi:MAG: transposase [Caldilineaceae bacterium]|nr:transposase [Caldilineaceae bacterium]